jgi:multiple sugar transport system substrate-binding protein
VTRRLRILPFVILLAASINCKSESTTHLRFSHFWAEPAQRAAMDSLLAGFKREHPEIIVDVTELSWNDGKTKLMLGFNSETAPDVIELGSDWVPQFASSGVLMDLTIANDSTLLKQAYSAPQYSMPPAMWGKHLFAVTWMLDTRVMFVNDSLVRATGQTDASALLGDWDNMKFLATAIQKHGALGCGVNGPDEHRLYKKFLPYVWSNGGELFDEGGKPTMTRPENVAALTYYIEQQSFGKMDLQKNLDDAFKRGSLGIWFSGSWMLAPLTKASFKWHTEPVPGANGHVGESFAGGEYLAINAKTKMPEQARIFLSYITRAKNELSFAKAVNMFPADTAMQLDSFYLTRREGPVFTAQLRHARMTPVIPQWLEVESIIEDEVSRALYQKETPQEAMAAMQQRTVELLREP